MANTYTQLYIHFVFAVKYRRAAIESRWEEKLHSYITGIVQNNGHKMLAINSAYDHLHMLIGLNPNQSISDLMRMVKSDSSEFVNREKLSSATFRWQEGYGAFSHSHSQLDRVIKYVLNQKEHHKKKTFREEYLKMLEDFDVVFDKKYIFKPLEE